MIAKIAAKYMLNSERDIVVIPREQWNKIVLILHRYKRIKNYLNGNVDSYIDECENKNKNNKGGNIML